MKIVVATETGGLDAQVSPVFGRAPKFCFVDSESLESDCVANPAVAQAGGAGIQAAEFVVKSGAKAVLAGDVGPNAFQVLQAAQVPCYNVEATTVEKAVIAFRQGNLKPLGRASAVSHSGMSGATASPAASHLSAQPQDEMAALHETLKDLRHKLAETMERIEKLAKES